MTKPKLELVIYQAKEEVRRDFRPLNNAWWHLKTKVSDAYFSWRNGRGFRYPICCVAFYAFAWEPVLHRLDRGDGDTPLYFRRRLGDLYAAMQRVAELKGRKRQPHVMCPRCLLQKLPKGG